MGLWSKPDEKEGKIREYASYAVADHPEMRCFVEVEILEWLQDTKPTPEGDYLFSVEGMGRLRFSLQENGPTSSSGATE